MFLWGWERGRASVVLLVFRPNIQGFSCMCRILLTTVQSTVRVTPYRCQSVDRTVSLGKVSRICLDRGGLAAVAPRKVRFIRRGGNQSGESGL